MHDIYNQNEPIILFIAIIASMSHNSTKATTFAYADYYAQIAPVFICVIQLIYL